jgi:hypothetical protein
VRGETHCDAKQNGIYFGSVDSTETHLITPTESAAQHASGYLLYYNHGERCQAQPRHERNERRHYFLLVNDP